MRYEGDNRQQGLYDHYVVGESMGLLDWLMANLHESRTKIKATLQGQADGIGSGVGLASHCLRQTLCCGVVRCCGE